MSALEHWLWLVLDLILSLVNAVVIAEYEYDWWHVVFFFLCVLFAIRHAWALLHMPDERDEGG